MLAPLAAASPASSYIPTTSTKNETKRTRGPKNTRKKNKSAQPVDRYQPTRHVNISPSNEPHACVRYSRCISHGH